MAFFEKVLRWSANFNLLFSNMRMNMCLLDAMYKNLFIYKIF